MNQFLVEDAAVMIRGLALPEEGNPTKVSVQDVIPLDKLAIHYPSVISIKVKVTPEKDRASALHELFQRKPGATSVRLKIEKPKEFAVLLDVPNQVRPDKEFISEIERICGPECYEKVAG